VGGAGFTGVGLLVMLIDSMIPAARADAGRAAVLGLRLGSGLSQLT
jgi:hypothetical protein